jgi:hypothetical protein
MIAAYYLFFTNSKRKYVEEKTTITLKSKQTSIGTVLNYLSNTSQLTDLPHFSLVTTFKETWSNGTVWVWDKLIKAQQRRYDMSGRSQMQGGKKMDFSEIEK